MHTMPRVGTWWAMPTLQQRKGLTDDLPDRVRHFDADEFSSATVKIGNDRVQAHLVQHHGVQVLDMVPALAAAHLIGRAGRDAPLMPPPASHIVNP